MVRDFIAYQTGIVSKSKKVTKLPKSFLRNVKSLNLKKLTSCLKANVGQPVLEIAGDNMELLTEEEHKIIDDLGSIHGRMCKICDEPLDKQEICALIHSLQSRVMSHAASRTYPGLYRKL